MKQALLDQECPLCGSAAVYVLADMLIQESNPAVKRTGLRPAAYFGR